MPNKIVLSCSFDVWESMVMWACPLKLYNGHAEYVLYTANMLIIGMLTRNLLIVRIGPYTNVNFLY